MTVRIVMTTADRGAAHNYLAETLRLLGAQAAAVDLFPTDPDVRWIGQTPGPIHVPTRTLTRIENGGRALLDAPPCDWVVHLEDDVRPCRDFLPSVARFLDRFERPDRKLVLLWSRDRYPGRSSAPDHPIDLLFGAVAVAMRRADALALGAWALEHAPTWRTGEARLRGFDKMMAAWHRARYPYIKALTAARPSLVQHVGRTSSLAHLKPRGGFWQSPTFTGEAFGG